MALQRSRPHSHGKVDYTSSLKEVELLKETRGYLYVRCDQCEFSESVPCDGSDITSVEDAEDELIMIFMEDHSLDCTGTFIIGELPDQS